MTKLTDHFTLEELTDSQEAARRGIVNMPHKHSQEYKNLQHLANTMETVRKLLDDKPILVSSGYRNPQVNKLVGGSPNSVHMQGLACDFTCPGFGTPLEICKRLELDMATLRLDQLIHEFKTWVHLGLRHGAPPRHMALTIDAKGTRTGFV